MDRTLPGRQAWLAATAGVVARDRRFSCTPTRAGRNGALSRAPRRILDCRELPHAAYLEEGGWSGPAVRPVRIRPHSGICGAGWAGGAVAGVALRRARELRS